MVNKLFSIITVCYNDADNLRKTACSVAAQTYKDYEYIVIDGGSADHTARVIQELGAAVTCFVSEPDRGLYDAMNKGLARATGHYVCFLNAGDVLAGAETLALLSTVAAAHGRPDVLYGDTAIVDGQGRVLRLRCPCPPKKLCAGSFRWGMCVCHQSFYVARRICAPYDLRYRLSADVDWCIRMLKAADRTANARQVLTLYLDGGLSVQQHRASLKERFAIMRQHYGLCTTLLAHAWFVLRLPLRKLFGCRRGEAIAF